MSIIYGEKILKHIYFHWVLTPLITVFNLQISISLFEEFMPFQSLGLYINYRNKLYEHLDLGFLLMFSLCVLLMLGPTLQ